MTKSPEASQDLSEAGIRANIEYLMARQTKRVAVMASDGVLEMHEVKGMWMDDARVKIKVAAELYPFRFVAVKPKPKKDGGGWSKEVFGE